jgi:site-specific recombinase XerD
MAQTKGNYSYTAALGRWTLRADRLVPINPVQGCRTMANNQAADAFGISKSLLLDVLDGVTYAAAGERHRMTKSGCEKRIKHLVDEVHAAVGIEGLNDKVPLSARVLRRRRQAVLAALDQYDPSEMDSRPERSLSPDRLREAAARIRGHSENANRDVALLYTMFTTGAKPIEIARLEVRDYLAAEGSVREVSQMRAEIALNGQARPLYFRTHRARDAIDTYLVERVRRRLGAGETASYRGLDPGSRLFLREDGQPFQVLRRETGAKGQFHCRGILDTYRTLFNRAGLLGVTTQSARRDVAKRLRERGADDDQIGELLGIKDLGALRQLLMRMRRPLSSVVENLL